MLSVIFVYHSHTMWIQRGLAPPGGPLGGPKHRQSLNIVILGHFRLSKWVTLGVLSYFWLHMFTLLLKLDLDFPSLFMCHLQNKRILGLKLKNYILSGKHWEQANYLKNKCGPKMHIFDKLSLENWSSI